MIVRNTKLPDESVKFGRNAKASDAAIGCCSRRHCPVNDAYRLHSGNGPPTSQGANAAPCYHGRGSEWIGDGSLLCVTAGRDRQLLHQLRSRVIAPPARQADRALGLAAHVEQPILLRHRMHQVRRVRVPAVVARPHAKRAQLNFRLRHTLQMRARPIAFKAPA